MSLWKFEDFEAEIDLTDVDVAETLELAHEKMNDEFKKVPADGKTSEIYKAQIRCFTVFFDTIFGDGATEQIMKGKRSLGKCLEAADSFYSFIRAEDEKFGEAYDKYRVQNHGNRQQRRYQKYQKYHKNNKGRR